MGEQPRERVGLPTIALTPPHGCAILVRMAYKQTCPTLAKVGDDEPIFVLRAQDDLAPTIIRVWCELMELNCGDVAKTDEARECADDMAIWAHNNESKIPD